MRPPDYVTKGGNVIEFGAVNTFGVRELRIGVHGIRLLTTVGGSYEFARSEVKRILRSRRKGFLGKWFSIELNSASDPDVWFGGNAREIVNALRERGWIVAEE
jgi:hypothetical protein